MAAYAARGAKVRQVPLVAEVRRLGELAEILGQGVLGHLQRQVRDGGRQVQEERLGAVGANEVVRAIEHDVERVLTPRYWS